MTELEEEGLPVETAMETEMSPWTKVHDSSRVL